MPVHAYTNWNKRESDHEEQVEPFRKYFFICESANTETFYFKKLIDLRKQLRIHPLIDIRLMEKTEEDKTVSNPKALIKFAEKQKGITENKLDQKHDKMVIVFDVDIYKGDLTKYNEIIKLGDGNLLAVTNPSFELFLLLHYENSYEELIKPNEEEILRNKKTGKRRYMAALFTDKSGINPKENPAVGDLAANIDIATKTDFQSVIQILKRGDLDSFFENLINKNINKSESVSESDRRLKIKNLFAREKSVWMIGEVLEVLVFFGLDEKALARWRSRNPENQNFILELAAGGMSRFDYDTIAQVFARCQAAKDKEGKPLSSAVAFVLKSLQHELTAVSNRKNARQSASESAQPKRFRDIDYMEGIERLNPDGTFVLKRKTEGR